MKDDKSFPLCYNFLSYEEFLELIARLALEVYAHDEHVAIEYKAFRLMDLLYEIALIKTPK